MLKKILSVALAFAVAATMLTACGNEKENVSKPDVKLTEVRGMTTAQIVENMGLGINLGNTFESCGTWLYGDDVSTYETGWGSPIVTKEIFEGYKSCGFNSVRIPVAWSNMMDEEYNIHPDLIARVKEVVTWAIECDLYVVLNIHWDGGWWEDFPTKKDKCMTKYEKVWTQLSAEFGDFGDRLIFESLNEEGGWASLWNRYSGKTDGKAESFGLLNEINQKFVDIVRASGKQNDKRHLLIAGYNTDFDLTCDELFVMPNDPANSCAVSVHYYTPSTFCILTEDASWGKAQTTWGSDEDYELLKHYMNLIKETFVDKGIPVIIGEYGVATKNKEAEDVNRFISAVCDEALGIGACCPMLWAVTKEHYDRDNFVMYDQNLQTMLNEINAKYGYEVSSKEEEKDAA